MKVVGTVFWGCPCSEALRRVPLGRFLLFAICVSRGVAYGRTRLLKSLGKGVRALPKCTRMEP